MADTKENTGISNDQVKTKSIFTGGGFGGTSYYTAPDGKDHAVTFNKDTKQYEDAGLAAWQVKKDKADADTKANGGVPSWARQKMKESPNWDTDKMNAEAAKKIEAQADRKDAGKKGALDSDRTSKEDRELAAKLKGEKKEEPKAETKEVKPETKPEAKEEPKPDVETVYNEVANDKDVDNAIQAATGTSLNGEAPDSETAKDGVKKLADAAGVNTSVNEDGQYSFTLDPRLETNWTDRIAIALTAISAIVCALSGGSVLPVNFKKITGTDEKMTKAKEVIANANEIFNANKEAKHGATEGAITSNRAVNKEAESYEGGRKQLKKDMKDVGEIAYSSEGTSAEQQIANDFRLDELNAMTEGDLAKIAAQSKANISQLMTQGQNEIALAKVVQDLKNKSEADTLKYMKSLYDEIGEDAYTDLYNALAQGVRSQHGIDSVWNGINIGNAIAPSHVSIMGQTVDKNTESFKL